MPPSACGFNGKVNIFQRNGKEKKGKQKKTIRACILLKRKKDTGLKPMSLSLEVPSRVELLYTVLQTVT